MLTDTRPNKIYTRTGDQGKTSLIGGSRVSKSDPRIETYGTVDELNSIVGMLICDLQSDYRHLSDLDPTYDIGAGKPQIAPLPGSRPAADEGANLTKELHGIQCDLFNVGSQLACEDEKFRSQLPSVSSERITDLENRMDEYSKALKPLKNFILPGGSRSSATAHLARTVCRRAERLCVQLHENSLANSPQNLEDGSAYLNANLQSIAAEGPVAEVSGANESTHLEGHLLITRFLNRLSDYFFVLARFLNARMRVEEPIWREKSTR